MYDIVVILWHNVEISKLGADLQEIWYDDYMLRNWYVQGID